MYAQGHAQGVGSGLHMLPMAACTRTIVALLYWRAYISQLVLLRAAKLYRMVWEDQVEVFVTFGASS